uniref:Lipase 4 n=1 Tax=Anthurium amnicola TaxID=1678845 RepID=A0A1D1Y645_9ARAE
MNLPNLKESIITSYWDTRPPTEDQVLHFPEENDPSRSSQSSLYTLISGVTSVASEVSSYWAKKLYATVVCPQDPISQCKRVMKHATKYEDWAYGATSLDIHEGKEQWKNEEESFDYDYKLLKARRAELQQVRKSGDLSAMIFKLRTSLSRNLGDMGQPKLYAHTHIGTKRLIEAYINEVAKLLNRICKLESDDITPKEKLEVITNTRQSFGRTALLLSGGATFGLAHIGVIKCLYEAKLLPRIISGASSGSIIAALLCTKTDDEIPTWFYEMQNLDFEVFDRKDRPDTLYTRLCRLFKRGVLYDGDVLIEWMRKHVGDMTFQEAFNRTRRILNVTVSSASVYEMPRLLNYLTAPNVLIWSAVAASCSVPFIYGSTPLMAKDKTGKIALWNPSGHTWIDGSVENDLPMNKLSELFNVNHFIVSQVNPHVVPFLQTKLIPSAINRMVSWFIFLAVSEIQHRLNQLSELGITGSLIYRIQAIVSQRYVGDITIVPQIAYTDFLNLLTNPTPEILKDATLRGERATWPKISIIRNHCQIELCLDSAVIALREQVLSLAVSPSESGGLDSLDLETPGNANEPEKFIRRQQRRKIRPLSTTDEF